MKKKVLVVVIAVAVLAVSIPLLAILGSRSDHRSAEYTGQWLDPERSGWVMSGIVWDRVVITEVYENCFFGESLCFDRTVKLNGALPENLGVGDWVWVSFQNWHQESGTGKSEGDSLYVGVLPESWDMWYRFVKVVFR